MGAETKEEQLKEFAAKTTGQHVSHRRKWKIWFQSPHWNKKHLPAIFSKCLISGWQLVLFTCFIFVIVAMESLREVSLKTVIETVKLREVSLKTVITMQYGNIVSA